MDMEADTKQVDWEMDLAELLSDLSNVQTDLLKVLSQKRQHMAVCDVEAMESLQPREQELCDRLQACHTRRAELLELAGNQGLPSDSIVKLASALPNCKKGKLDKQVKEASSQMRLLQHHSLTNWVVAQRTLLHVSQMLEIIASGGQLNPTYGNDEPVHSRGALVDREA